MAKGSKVKPFSDYLADIQEFYRKNHVMPSFDDLMQITKKARSTISNALDHLVAEGYLERIPTGEKKNRIIPGPQFFQRRTSSACIRAGFPSLATEALDDSITLDDYLIEHPSSTIIIKVKGDSMDKAGIFDGDMVVVECGNKSANPGNIVIANIDGEQTLKYLQKGSKGPFLRPCSWNPEYNDLHPKNSLQVMGVVVGVVRKLQ